MFVCVIFSKLTKQKKVVGSKVLEYGEVFNNKIYLIVDIILFLKRKRLGELKSLVWVRKWKEVLCK